MPEEISKDDQRDYGELFFSWTFPEFERHERDRGWYIKAAAATFFLLLFALLNPQLIFRYPFVILGAPNFTFFFLIIVISLIVLLFHRSDNEIEFKISEDGILVNEKFYDYKNIKNFYIIYEPPEVKTLYFEPKAFFSPRIPIALEDQNPVEIRELLLQYLEEDIDRDNEPLSEQFSRLFKL